MGNRINVALTNSPLFHLSLSSKELFHSNFLAWIGDTYPDMFTQILRELGCKCCWSIDDYRIMREYKNHALCLRGLKDDDIPFILENKVKSIPNKRQLDKYAEKIPTSTHDLILLSLATEFLDKDDIEKEGKWIIKSYKELHDAISKYKDYYITNTYHKSLVKDYCDFIENLHELAKTWKVNNQDPFLTKSENDEKDGLRMKDVRDKIKSSQLCALLNTALKQTIEVDTTSGLSIEDIKNRKNCCLKEVFTNWGFTHGLGLIEAKVKINNRYVLLVQIQGKSYCHGIEWIDGGSESHAKYWELTQKEKIIEGLDFFQFGDIDNSIFPDCTNGKIEFKKHKGENTKRNYNKYNNTFLYQKKDIDPTATVADVIGEVVKDIQRIIVKGKKID